MKNCNHSWRYVAGLTAVLGLAALTAMPSNRPNKTVRSMASSCIISEPGGRPVTENNDPLAKLLLAADPCPANVFELRSRILAAGGRIKTTLVANRGFHNAKSLGDFPYFSMFEIVSGRLESIKADVAEGDFFFGHFTGTDGAKTIFADQRTQSGSLMIEAIAFDSSKQVFNFYELLGTGRSGQWFYRGDSTDILADVKLLHRQPNPARPQFGGRLRCSGCHTAGGPIMKEIEAPHNDWWRTERPVPFGVLKPDAALSAVLKGLVDANQLSDAAKAGLKKIEASEKFQKAKRTLSLQEQLRPLFCPVELNLDSDPMPLDQGDANIQVPSAFFIHPMLARGTVTIERAHYEAALKQVKTKLPETSRADADHAWLTPVKAFSDTLAIESLIKQGVIDEEFAIDILAVDLTNPVFSDSRCKLLLMLPDKAEGGWKEVFKAKLAASSDPAAQELLKNLTDPRRNAQFHRARAASVLTACQSNLKNKDVVIKMFSLLAQRRAEAGASEISKNPKGQILEPGFRVIFPVTPGAKPRQFKLTEDGMVTPR